MSAADRQDEVIRLLSDPSVYGPGVEKVERVETHVSEVFLGGERAVEARSGAGDRR